MKKIELVFIPTPLIGHLSPAIEFVKLLVHRYPNLSITMLLIKLPFDAKTENLMESLSCISSAAAERIRFITLPEQPLDEETSPGPLSLKAIIENHKVHVAETLTELTAGERGPNSPILAGVIVDMFCINMIDLANQFGIPTYLFFITNAGFLALLFQLQELYDLYDKDMDEVMNTATEFAIPGFINPVPGKIVSAILFSKDIAEWIHGNTRRFREASGLLVNSFLELESDTMNWFSANSQLPPVYSVGPLLKVKKIDSAASSGITTQTADILNWLDGQPPSSVVFLCFGSVGSFNGDQIKEISHALERTGVRFLWSLQQALPKDKHGLPSDYANPEDVLPEGFLDRTTGVGKVIGWAPQVEILAHPATGGFISHCGWNSTLESLWYIVPMATWPMYGEQQFNAFEMAVELGLAAEISIDYSMMDHMEKGFILSAEKIESGIRKLMEDNEEMKKMIKIKSEEGKKAMMEGGSSFTALNRFMDAVIANTP